LPLTLSAWQYDLLMRWIAHVTTPQPAAAAMAGAAVSGAAAALSPAAAARREAVLRRIG